MAGLDFERLREQARQFLGGFTTGQKVMTAIAVVALAVGGWYFMSASSKPEYHALYTDLDEQDAARVTEQLQSNGVSYELADGGRTIRVPEADVYQARLDLSAAGLPSGGNDGYALLDKQGITTSEFRQRVDYQRALQGELSRTITAIDGVEAASVHLVIPEDDVFADDDEQASASVLVTSSSGEELSAGQVQSIVHLVASSVSGMTAEDVTVADASGRVLSAPGQAGIASDLNAGQTTAYNAVVAQDVQQMLAAVLGPGHAVVKVNATLDFDQRASTTETYTNPGEGGEAVPPLEESTLDEELTGGGAGGTGVLGPDGTPTGGGETPTDYQKTEESRVNAVNKTVEEIRRAPGAVERQSVSVFLDEEAVAADQVPLITSNIEAAAGFDAGRGDVVEVTRIAFEDQTTEAVEPAAAEGTSWTTYAQAGVAVLAVLALLFLIRRSTKRALRRAPIRVPLDVRQLAPATGTLPGPGREPANLELTLPDVPAPTVSVERGEPSVQGEVNDLIERQPEEVAATLRTWLADRRS